jgi:hypothetical protein
MSLRIRRGTDAQRSGITFDMGEIVWTTDGQQLWVGDGLTQGGSPVVGANIAGFGLAYDPTTRRISVAGLSADNITNGLNNRFFSTDLAQSAAASLFVTGVHSNISFVYDEELGRINAAVTLDGSGISDIVADTSPQLGGNLDLNTRSITGTGDINIDGVITANELDGAFVGVVTGNIENPVLSTNTAGVNVVGVTSGEFGGDTQLATLNINGSKGSLEVPTNTLAGEFVSKLSLNGYRGTQYVGMASIISQWQPTADFNEEFPESKINFVVNGPTGTTQIASFDSNGALFAPILVTGSYATTSYPAAPPNIGGLIIFDNTTKEFKGWNGTSWVLLG